MLLFMLKNTNSLLLFLFLFSFQTIYGQISPEKKSLIAVLKSIEKKFEVRFTYETEKIQEIKVEFPPERLNLSETLEYLNNNTAFNYTKLDERFITVVQKNTNEFYCGTVINTTNNNILIGATISTTNHTFITSTNSEGEFHLPLSIKKKRLVISFLGFEDVIIQVSDLQKVDCIQFVMRQKVSVLKQVFISNYFTKGIEKNYNGSTTINTNNFGLLPGQVDNDVLQIIQVIPGIESVAEKVSNINIRGGNNDESLILWDDIKMYQNGHFFGLISAFDPSLTNNVTVYKNGTPARFGEGVSGVIDMKSNNNLTNSFTGGAGFNLISSNVYVSAPITKNLGIQFSGRRSLNDFIETNVYTSYSDRIFQDTEISNDSFITEYYDITADEDFNFYDFSTKLLWNISKRDQVRVNFLRMKNSLDFTEKIEETSISKTSTLDQRNTVGGISWNRFWTSKIKTTAFVYGSSYDLKSLNKDILSVQEINQENEVLDTGIKLDADIYISEKYTVQTGYHFSEVGISNTQDVNLPRLRIFEKYVLQSHIIFGNLKYITPNKKTNINAGLRTNYYPKFSSFIVEPRLSIHQKLGNGFAAELLGEFKNQTTSQRIDFQSDFLGVEKRRWVLVNENDFPIIESKQISLGFMYNKNSWFLDLEGFYKNTEGISTSTQGFQNQYQFIKSTGSYDVKGAEITINKKTQTFSTWLSYTYMENDYTFEDLSPSEFPNNIDVRHSVNLAGTYIHNKFKVSLGFIWHSGKPNTIPVEGNEIISFDGKDFINFDEPNAERLPDYFRSNISAEYRWKISNKVESKFNLALLNIFNRENILNTRYTVVNDDDGVPQVNRINEISLGFTPNISFQILF